MMRVLGRAAAVPLGAAAIVQHLRHLDPRRFGQLIGRVELALACVRDVTARRYRLPWRTLGALTAALAYFVAPIDALPDFVPLTGFLDDAAVLGLVFGAAESDLRRYCRWRGLDPEEFFDGA